MHYVDLVEDRVVGTDREDLEDIHKEEMGQGVEESPVLVEDTNQVVRHKASQEIHLVLDLVEEEDHDPNLLVVVDRSEEGTGVVDRRKEDQVGEDLVVIVEGEDHLGFDSDSGAEPLDAGPEVEDETQSS